MIDLESSQNTPRPSSQRKDLFAPEGQRVGNKRQIQKTENERVGERNKGEKKKYFPQRDKGLPLDKEETDIAHWQIEVYKGKNPC